MTIIGILMAAAMIQPTQEARFILPKLPYSHDALAPVISKETVDYHWGKHIQAYINNLNKLILGTEFENATLDEINAKSKGAIYNNGAQVWNHIHYFETFSPKPQLAPTGDLLSAINRDFGSLDEFMEEFVAKGLGQFGSGWVWLAKDDKGKLSIIPMPNAENPVKDGFIPLLGFDVWEHAYYLDYQNLRGDHLKALWKIVDWGVVEQRY